jgi:KDO2-lipid IV(A) lauroyltransferase
MNAVFYYLAYSFLWLITLLPLRVLYLVSWFLTLPLYHLVRYRRKTVMTNLTRSFPGRSRAELRAIARTFYHQLSDYFLEWMFRIHMGERENSLRLHYRNPEIFEPYRKQGRSIMLLLSHYGNWEWPTRISIVSGYPTLAIYQSVRNRYFDRLFIRLRGQFGAICVPMESTLRRILEYNRSGTPVLVFTLADQRPQWLSIQHWTRFLNQDTPVITGPEKIARKFNMVTVLLSLSKVKRGYYEAVFRVISENPAEAAEFEITRRYLGILEKQIREKPELYLWTHKRWKYRKDEAKNPVDIGPPHTMNPTHESNREPVP